MESVLMQQIKQTKPVVNNYYSMQNTQLFLTYPVKHQMPFKLRGIFCSTFGNIITPFVFLDQVASKANQ